MDRETVGKLRELGEKVTAAKWTVIGKVEFDREPMVVISIQTPRGLLTLSANGLPAKGEMRAIAELICLMRNNLKQFLDAAERVERLEALIGRVVSSGLVDLHTDGVEDCEACEVYQEILAIRREALAAPPVAEKS